MAQSSFVDEVEGTLDAWTADLIARARALQERLAKHRKALDAKGRRQGGYRPLMLVVAQKGNTLEIRWQKADKHGPYGQRPKTGLWVTAIRKMPLREGNGYPYATLGALAVDQERDLVLELEEQARRIRWEHANNIALRKGLNVVRRRERAQREGEKRDAQ